MLANKQFRACKAQKNTRALSGGDSTQKAQVDDCSALAGIVLAPLHLIPAAMSPSHGINGPTTTYNYIQLHSVWSPCQPKLFLSIVAVALQSLVFSSRGAHGDLHSVDLYHLTRSAAASAQSSASITPQGFVFRHLWVIPQLAVRGSSSVQLLPVPRPLLPSRDETSNLSQPLPQLHVEVPPSGMHSG